MDSIKNKVFLIILVIILSISFKLIGNLTGEVVSDKPYIYLSFEQNDPQLVGQNIFDIETNKTGIRGNAYSFNGKDSFISLNTIIPDNTLGMTIEAWVYINNFRGIPQVIFFEGSDAPANDLQLILNDDGSLDYYTKDNHVLRTYSGIIFAEKWYHIIATNNATYKAIYIDGVLKADAEGNFNNNGYHFNVNIGSWNDGRDMGFYLNGSIDELRIYNRMVTQGEVLDNFVSFYLDTDNDGIVDNFDNCFNVNNLDQADLDNDSIGDVCDEDIDNDTILNINDNCINLSNFDQTDLNYNKIGDACEDTNNNGILNNIDWDDDGDNVPDEFDNCPLDYNPGQIDTNGDGIWDQQDTDNDGIGDVCEYCTNSLISEECDNFPICVWSSVNNNCIDCPSIPDCSRLGLELCNNTNKTKICNGVYSNCEWTNTGCKTIAPSISPSGGGGGGGHYEKEEIKVLPKKEIKESSKVEVVINETKVNETIFTPKIKEEKNYTLFWILGGSLLLEIAIIIYFKFNQK